MNGYVFIVLVVEFASGQFTGSESSGFIEVIVRVTGGSSSTPITVTVTPSEQSPLSAMGKHVLIYTRRDNYYNYKHRIGDRF